MDGKEIFLKKEHDMTTISNLYSIQFDKTIVQQLIA